MRLSALGGRHTAVQAGQVEAETPQAQAAGPAGDADAMAGHPEAVEERQSRPALQARGPMRPDSAAVVP